MPPVHTANLSGQDTLEHFIGEYPHRQQAKLMTAWLASHTPGTFSFTGLVDPLETTVVSPQATVDYGHCWFSLSEGPAIVRAPAYDKFMSVSVFDMLHNVPGVVTDLQRPVLLIRPGQELPVGDFTVVELETDQGLVLTRMVVDDNLDEVRALSASITMEGGNGDMHRPVQRFSPQVEEIGLKAIAGFVPLSNPDNAFGKKSGDVGALTLAGAVMQGQLGTPSDTVRYHLIMHDDDGALLNGEDTYVVTVPAGIVEGNGYFSITVYGTDDKMLIPNDRGVYDQTTYSATPESDGTHTVTLSPSGGGMNGISTGKPFYALLRAYVPTPGAALTPTVRRG